MGDTAVLLIIVVLQAMISFLSAWKLSGKRPNLIFVPSLILPAVTALLGFWMAFGMGRVTDLGAMAIAALVVSTITLLIVGAVAVLAAKFLKK